MVMHTNVINHNFISYITARSFVIFMQWIAPIVLFALMSTIPFINRSHFYLWSVMNSDGNHTSSDEIHLFSGGRWHWWLPHLSEIVSICSQTTFDCYHVWGHPGTITLFQPMMTSWHGHTFCTFGPLRRNPTTILQNYIWNRDKSRRLFENKCMTWIYLRQ